MTSQNNNELFIKVKHRYLKEQGTHHQTLIIYLNDELLKQINFNQKPKIKLQEDIFYIKIGHYSLMFDNLSKSVINQISKNNFSFLLVKEDETFIASYSV
jgi:hypothetical protein